LRHRCQGRCGRWRGWQRRRHRRRRAAYQRGGSRGRCALLPTGRGWRWRCGWCGRSAGRCQVARPSRRRRTAATCGRRCRRGRRLSLRSSRRRRCLSGRGSGLLLFPFPELLLRLPSRRRCGCGCGLSLRSGSRRRRRLARRGPSPFPFPELLLRLPYRRWCRRSRSLWRGSRWRRRWRWRRWRRPRWGCGRRWRGRPGWCGSRRRRWWRGPRRRGRGGWRRLRRGRGRLTFRRLLGFSVGTKLFLRRGLRHHQRRALRMRWRASELHRCEGCRGKQREAKFGHDNLGFPGKALVGPWQD
jgi:hypothetical protein